MLTSANVTVHMAAHYYEADNYYTSGEVLAPARWTGRFAKELGLEGRLEPHNFEQMLRGFGPQGQPLIERPDNPFPKGSLVQSALFAQEQKEKAVTTLKNLFGTPCTESENHNREVEFTVRLQKTFQSLETKLEKGPLKSKAVQKFTGRFTSLLDEAQAQDKDHHQSRPLPTKVIREILLGVSEPTPRRAALDLTFSAPKSVSLQSLVFGDTRLIDAHRQAVSVALSHVEDHFSVCRVGPKDARENLHTGKLAIALFEHDLSREEDPHLHTHSVVLNMTPGQGKVRALHNDELFQNKRMLGTLYRNELALQVRGLGYDVQLGREGTFEIAGFTREQITAFSKRHMEMWERGLSHQGEAYERFYEGRRSKNTKLDRGALKENWMAAADGLRLKSLEPAKSLEPVIRRVRQGEVLGAPLSPIEQEVVSLTEKNVSFRLQDLQTCRLESTMGRVNSREVFAQVEEHARSVLIAGRTPKTFTTEEALERERNYRQKVEEGLGKHEPFLTDSDAQKNLHELQSSNVLIPELKAQILSQSNNIIETEVSSPHIRESIKSCLETRLWQQEKLSPRELFLLRREVEDNLRRSGKRGSNLISSLRLILDPVEKEVQAMTHGQIQAVQRTVTSQDQVIIWQGVAGSGKTFSMARVAARAKEQGYAVTGLAPSAAAAKQLSQDARLEARTVDAHLMEAPDKASAASQRPEKSLWIVDEAGMLSASHMEKLLNKASQTQTRVLLIGDTHQLPAIAAGNPFLDLQRNSRTTLIHLEESVRPRTPLLQQVVQELYSPAQSGAQVGASRLRSSTFEASTLEERCSVAASAFLSLSPKKQRETLVLAKTNEERAALTFGIRAGLQAAGKLQGPEVVLKRLRSLDFTDLEKKKAQNYMQGMVIVPFEKIGTGLPAGQTQTVTAIHFKENALTLQDEKGKKRLVNCASLGRTSLYMPETLKVAKGDRLIWTRNEKKKGEAHTLNNDLFMVTRVSQNKVTLQSEQHPGLKKELLLKHFHHIDHAWAFTLHRAQGQTSKGVILVTDDRLKAQEFLVGVTRASEEVLVVTGSQGTIEQIVAKKQEKEIAHEAWSQSFVGEHH